MIRLHIASGLVHATFTRGDCCQGEDEHIDNECTKRCRVYPDARCVTPTRCDDEGACCAGYAEEVE